MGHRNLATMTLTHEEYNTSKLLSVTLSADWETIVIVVSTFINKFLNVIELRFLLQLLLFNCLLMGRPTGFGTTSLPPPHPHTLALLCIYNQRQGNVVTVLYNNNVIN